MSSLFEATYQRIETFTNTEIRWDAERWILSLERTLSESRKSIETISMKHALIKLENEKDIWIYLDGELSLILKLKEETIAKSWMTMFIDNGVLLKPEDRTIDKRKRLTRITSIRKTEEMIQKVRPKSSIREVQQYPRLLRFSGFRNQVTSTWADPKVKSLNKNDCFILDDGKEYLYYWRGKSANMFVRDECQNIFVMLKERSSSYNVFSIEQGEEHAMFWELLGGKDTVKDEVEDVATLSHDWIEIDVETNSYQKCEPKIAPNVFLDTGFECCYIAGEEDPQVKSIIEQYKVDNQRRAFIVRNVSMKDKIIAHYMNKSN